MFLKDRLVTKSQSDKNHNNDLFRCQEPISNLGAKS